MNRLLLCAAIVVLLYLVFAREAHAALLEQARPLQVGCPGVPAIVWALAISGGVLWLFASTLLFQLTYEKVIEPRFFGNRS